MQQISPPQKVLVGSTHRQAPFANGGGGSYVFSKGGIVLADASQVLVIGPSYEKCIYLLVLIDGFIAGFCFRYSGAKLPRGG